MGYGVFDIRMPVGYTENELMKKVEALAGSREFTYQIEHKSLDARKKGNISWQLRLGVLSPAIKGTDRPGEASLVIPFKKRNGKIFVAGTGPAGFFAAYVLQKAGFSVTILERGKDVGRRAGDIERFEREGLFSETGNYAFGEGGAGTFSDGKLTSRSKHISLERRFIIDSYVGAGAPEEIKYLAYPHVGSDNLRKVVRNLRKDFVSMGGEIRFETRLTDLSVSGGRVKTVITDAGPEECSSVIIASGHSAFDTYRMLMARGVQFRTKNFALGTRAEHRQQLINQAQWGVASLPGVKAAEYRLTSEGSGNIPVYSFCMCPGGIVVPATAFADNNIVNGMSLYSRGGPYANAACVAGIHPAQLAGEGVSAYDTLAWLEE
ncbi:MAG: NAD(P)/FAD-dependent oxidoreductase, partial [Bacteroidota bacterium]